MIIFYLFITIIQIIRTFHSLLTYSHRRIYWWWINEINCVLFTYPDDLCLYPYIINLSYALNIFKFYDISKKKENEEKMDKSCWLMYYLFLSFNYLPLSANRKTHTEKKKRTEFIRVFSQFLWKSNKWNFILGSNGNDRKIMEICKTKELRNLHEFRKSNY